MESETNQSGNLATWSTEQLLETISETLATAEAFRQVNLHPKRIRAQLEAHPRFTKLLASWPELDANGRRQVLTQLTEQASEAYSSPVPRCVRCGQCCRQASPSLHVQDLPLLGERRLLLADLVCYRRGELLVPFGKQAAESLQHERIKLRQRADGACIYLDEDSELCTRYADRPWQCRAQACWDPALAQQLQQQPPLTRELLFADSEQLQQLIREHDNRCPAAEFNEVFELLRSSGGDEQLARRAVEIVAYEEHFRSFVAERLGIVEHMLDLVFGRSFVGQLERFGFEIATQGETRVLRPRQPVQPAESDFP